MQLSVVPADHVGQFWHLFEPLLAPVFDGKAGNGEVTLEQLRMMLGRGSQHLISIENDGELIGALTIQFINYPNKRIALGTAFGGRGITTQEVMDRVKVWCKGMGASEFRTYAKDAQARLYEKVGLSKRYNVVGVEL